MVMVEINSNAILVEPMKSHKDEEVKRVSNALLLRLKRAGSVPKKHVLDNKVSDNMKNHICDTCKFDDFTDPTQRRWLYATSKPNSPTFWRVWPTTSPKPM
jgi:hypothetical protein